LNAKAASCRQIGIYRSAFATRGQITAPSGQRCGSPNAAAEVEALEQQLIALVGKAFLDAPVERSWANPE